MHPVFYHPFFFLFIVNVLSKEQNHVVECAHVVSVYSLLYIIITIHTKKNCPFFFTEYNLYRSKLRV